MDEETLAAQRDAIDALNTKLERSGDRIRALRSIEMNLSPTGEGDMDPAALARLDLVLGAFHSRLRVREDQTTRYVAAVSNPTVHVLAHPRGRRFGARLGLTADWRVVFEAAAEHRTAVEIDAHPDRQDLDVELLNVARETGVTFSIGTDAHHPDELGFLNIGLAAALRAGLPRERILNFAPTEALLRWTRG
jgi:histidinol phosphatase-like PHP family hydrolase